MSLLRASPRRSGPSKDHWVLLHGLPEFGYIALITSQQRGYKGLWEVLIDARDKFVGKQEVQRHWSTLLLGELQCDVELGGGSGHHGVASREMK